jgi:hypothetical protein
MDIFPLTEILDKRTHYLKQYILKTQSALIEGEDIREQIDDFEINRNFIKTILQDFPRTVEKRQQRFNKRDEYDYNKDMCRFAMKELLRAGYYLSMIHEPRLTFSKEEMFEIFSRNNKDLLDTIQKIKDWYYNPTDNRQSCLEFYKKTSKLLINKLNQL